MNKYVFTTASHAGNSVSTSCIVAQDEFDALAKAYKHYGGYRLTNEEFELLCRNTPIQRIYRLFRDFTGESILYFALKPDECFICDLTEIK